ncbi:MAG: hypothetical protein FWG65_08180 [Turicibacter sp.]|nr:hypothetical protein [Turicibacter sp.]
MRTIEDIIVFDGDRLITEEEMFAEFEHHFILLRYEDDFMRKYPGYRGWLVAAVPVDEELDDAHEWTLLDEYGEEHLDHWMIKYTFDRRKEYY